jgi:hypothetical protein
VRSFDTQLPNHISTAAQNRREIPLEPAHHWHTEFFALPPDAFVPGVPARFSWLNVENLAIYRTCVRMWPQL